MFVDCFYSIHADKLCFDGEHGICNILKYFIQKQNVSMVYWWSYTFDGLRKTMFFASGGFRPDWGMTDVFAEKRQPAGTVLSFLWEGLLFWRFPDDGGANLQGMPPRWAGASSLDCRSKRKDSTFKKYFLIVAVSHTEKSRSILYDSW